MFAFRVWVGVAVAVAAGCGGGPPAQVRYGGPVALTLVNDTPMAACYVRMSPSEDDEWGDDWLASNEVMMPGTERTFSIAPSAAWDIRVDDCEWKPIMWRRRINVSTTQRLGIRDLTPYGGAPPPPPPPPPPLGAQCNVAGAWRGTGTDQQGTQWVWTMTLTQNGNQLDGAIDWRASTNAAGLERVRGTVDCTTHAFVVQGYVLERANGLILGTYRGVFGGDWRSLQGGWAEGVPGNFVGQRAQ